MVTLVTLWTMIDATGWFTFTRNDNADTINSGRVLSEASTPQVVLRFVSAHEATEKFSPDTLGIFLYSSKWQESRFYPVELIHSLGGVRDMFGTAVVYVVRLPGPPYFEVQSLDGVSSELLSLRGAMERDGYLLVLEKTN